MAIEAPVSKYKKNNLMIFIILCIVAAVWFGYDGYFSKKFIEKHQDVQGNPDSTLAFNRKSPPYFIGAAVLLGVYLFVVSRKKIIADENELIISDKERISYDSIQKINKTNFESKGSFIITYKNKDGTEVNRKLSDRTYDNLTAVLEYLVEKIS